jgi:hypothetical protein
MILLSSPYLFLLSGYDNLPDHHSEMVSADLRLRACAKNSQHEKQLTCTGFVDYQGVKIR